MLLIIDAIDDFAFAEGREALAGALPMAAHLRQLKARARRSGIPTVYVNDNFDRWRSYFRTVVAHCGSLRWRGREVTRLPSRPFQDPWESRSQRRKPPGRGVIVPEAVHWQETCSFACGRDSSMREFFRKFARTTADLLFVA